MTKSKAATRQARFRAALQILGETQRSFARSCGVSESYVSLIASGKKRQQEHRIEEVEAAIDALIAKAEKKARKRYATFTEQIA